MLFGILCKIEKTTEYLPFVQLLYIQRQISDAFNYIWSSQNIIQAVIQNHGGRDFFHGILRRNESPVKLEIW